MRYEKPSFVEIDMNAEIGAYQADFVEAKRETEQKEESTDSDRSADAPQFDKS